MSSRWEIKKPHAEKPCHELEYCPYGFLVEQFPVSTEIEKEQFVCRVFGHICPVFCVKEDKKEGSR